MRIPLRFLLLGISASLLTVTARAQDPLAASTPEPAPAPQAGSPSEYPDIESLREPGSTAKLFPAQPVNPPTIAQGQGGNNGRRNNAVPGGQHRRNVRANDQLVDQADADPLELRVAYRRAKTTVMARDPGLATLLDEAAHARTEVDKRAYLKEYYTRLFAEVRGVDRSPEMKKHLALLADVARQRYDPQRRVVGGEEDIIRGGGGRRGGRR